MKKRTVIKAVKAVAEGRETPLNKIKLNRYVASMILKYDGRVREKKR